MARVIPLASEKVDQKRRPSIKWSEIAFQVVIALCVIIGVVITALPFVWMAVSSLGGANMMMQMGFSWQMFNPLNWTIKPYLVAWRLAGLSKYLTTTVIYAVACTLLATATSAMAGYAFGRLHFPGRGILFGLTLSTMMIPGSVTFLPLFVLILRMPLFGGNDIFGMGGTGLYDTYAGLILPNMVSAGSIFLFRQFFQTLPGELEDAGRIDGASELGILWRIVLPLSGPVVTVVALFQFQGSWNAFLWPLVISRSERLYTISVGLYSLAYGSGSMAAVDIYQSVLLAGSVLAVLPILLLFVIFQRQFVQGIALTGIK